MNPQTSTEVAQGLARLSRQLDSAVTDLARLDEAAIRARSAFEVAYARAFLTAEGAMDIRKQDAVLQTSDLKLTAELAEAQVRATKESIRALGTRIDVGRSLGTAIRAEVSLAGAP